MPSPFSVFASTFTAFHPDHTVNVGLIPDQVRALCKDQVDGAFICGTTGEGATLSNIERRQIADAWVAAAPKHFKVIVHVGHASAHEAAEIAGHAQSIGAHSVAAIAPYFFKPRSAVEIVDALAPIAASAPKLPFYYYHVPAATGITVPAVSVAREARQRIPNFGGVKFTDVDLNDLAQLVEECGDTLEVFFGRDDDLLPALSLGVRQAVGMSYNYTAPLVRRMVSAFDRGNMGPARQAQTPIRKLIAASQPHGTVNALKALTSILHVDCGPSRPPLATVAPSEARAILHNTGLAETLQCAFVEPRVVNA